MPTSPEYLTVIERSLAWLRGMLVNPDGSQGVYERYRIDAGQINPWVRPDCTMEVARLFMAYGQYVGDATNMAIGRRLATYVVSLQRKGEVGWLDGSFPFYRFCPRHAEEVDIGSLEAREVTFPNDNGKIPERLVWFYRQTNDELFRSAVRRSLAYLTQIQAEDGSFSRTDEGDEAALKGADFVAWPVIALMQGAMLFHEEEYRMAAVRGISWLYEQITPSGRMRTSFETAQTEAWRPPSSETAVALKAFATVARFTRDPAAWDGMTKLGKALIAWQDESGAIRNGDEASRDASLQNDPDLTDMVYTNGYALLALQDAFRANGNAVYRVAAERLAQFLARVQCQGESDQWDGSWRGSYSLSLQRWHGRANQNNELDEGGMYSAYTGWSTAPIAYGLLRLLPKKK
ncbi:MAG: hypothetical protein M1546_20200 [Chloroflexi bacterium]|nr:hypothetical protein [Chloroflexota bacterium]